MLKYFVLDRGDELSRQLSETFHQLAKHYGLMLNEESPDVVLSIGGDGTLLHAFHKFAQKLEQTAFVGIHTGHLGFYADWKADEIEHLAEMMAHQLQEKEKRFVQYPLLEVEVHTEYETTKHVALNEVTIKGVDGTLVARVNINDMPFENFRGDGICISTPSGSTAYNKSLGGAVIHPSLETIQIAEIASINNRVYRTLGSPIILPKHHFCEIVPKKKQNIMLSIDHILRERNDIVSIRGKVSDRKVRFARFRPFPFWNRVRDAFIDFEDTCETPQDVRGEAKQPVQE